MQKINKCGEFIPTCDTQIKLLPRLRDDHERRSRKAMRGRGWRSCVVLSRHSGAAAHMNSQGSLLSHEAPPLGEELLATDGTRGRRAGSVHGSGSCFSWWLYNMHVLEASGRFSGLETRPWNGREGGGLEKWIWRKMVDIIQMLWMKFSKKNYKIYAEVLVPLLLRIQYVPGQKTINFKFTF